jgi:hypothetical protein
VLILETVDVILGRELTRRGGTVPQKVADGIVVLAMCQPPYSDCRLFMPGAGCFFFPVLQGLLELSAAQLSQSLNPRPERGLLGGSRFDPFPSGVRDSIRRFPKDQRIFNMIAVYKGD